MSLQVAFKEWAVIVEALLLGKQAIILRKGGIADPDGLFRPEHPRFWLYPTYVHQQETGIEPQALDSLRESLAEVPPAHEIHFRAYAEVTTVCHLAEESQLDLLGGLHIWSPETVRMRFHYRRPGLFVLLVRIYQLATPIIVPVMPEYDGCKTWVELAMPLDTTGAQPVMDDMAYAQVGEELGRRLGGLPKSSNA